MVTNHGPTASRLSAIHTQRLVRPRCGDGTPVRRQGMEPTSRERCGAGCRSRRVSRSDRCRALYGDRWRKPLRLPDGHRSEADLPGGMVVPSAASTRSRTVAKVARSALEVPAKSRAICSQPIPGAVPANRDRVQSLANVDQLRENASLLLVHVGGVVGAGAGCVVDGHGILGAQMVGHRDSAVAKRIDVYAAALHHALSVDAISDLDLSYMPPLGSPYDAVQIAAHAWTRSLTPTRQLSHH
jgi:hypothetical protein